MTPVAIVVLHYASLENIKNCVKNLYEMDYPSKLLLVIDNASAQPCEDVVHQLWPGSFVARAEKNLGVAGGRNLGFKLAQQRGAEWAFCVDDDAVVERRTLSALMEKALEFENVAVVGPKTCVIDRPNILLHAIGKHYKSICQSRSIGFLTIDNGQYDHLDKSDWFPGFAALFNLSVVEKIGGFDEQMAPYGPEDHDWYLRARNAKYEVLFSHRAHVWHPQTGASGNLTLIKIENAVRGRILFVRKQPEIAIRLLGHIFTIYQWILKPFPGVARSKKIGPYYSAVWQGIGKAHHAIKTINKTG
jgi:GT2 family glycosyltransferase